MSNVKFKILPHFDETDLSKIKNALKSGKIVFPMLKINKDDLVFVRKGDVLFSHVEGVEDPIKVSKEVETLNEEEVYTVYTSSKTISKKEEPRKLNNLPAHLTSYIGRGKVIREIKKLISEHRLITLTGPGGIGKTRLALQVTSEVQDEFRDGVWLVELASLDDPAQVAHTISRVLALGEREGVSPEKSSSIFNKDAISGKDAFRDRARSSSGSVKMFTMLPSRDRCEAGVWASREIPSIRSF